MLDDHQTQLIAVEVIRTLRGRFESYPTDTEKNRNAPFHEAFLEAFKDDISKHVSDTSYLITLSSWLHGLNTTLGAAFFENVAHILSTGEKNSFKNQELGIKQQTNITTIITDLQNSAHEPNIKRERDLIKYDSSDMMTNAPNLTADCYVETSDSILAIELKSVRPNSGEMKSEKNKILNGTAVLEKLNPNKEIEFFIGFPFDPLDEGTGYDKDRFMKSIINMNKYFHPDEVLLAEELWNKLSGEENTMENLLVIIRDIATPNFMEEFEHINKLENYKNYPDKTREILKRWHLKEELLILNHIDELFEKSKKDKKLNRFLHTKLLVNSSNIYSVDRHNYLKEFIDA